MEDEKKDIILMAILTVTRKDVLDSATELGMSEEQVTEDLINKVQGSISQVLHNWRGLVKNMVTEVIKIVSTECPLGMDCSSSCAWREIGQCTKSPVK